MNDLFHQILVHLYDINGLHRSVDITDFLKQTLGDNYNDPTLLRSVETTLGQLGVAGFIARTSQPILGRPGNGKEKNNLDEHRINVTLELLGHNYIGDKIKEANQNDVLRRQTDISKNTAESVIATNKFSRGNATWNTRILGATLVVAAISAFASLKNWQIVRNKNSKDQSIEKQTREIDSLRKTLSKAQADLSSQKKLLDSLQKMVNEKPNKK